MNNLKFLNRRIIQFILFIFILPSQAEEAIDIWNIEDLVSTQTIINNGELL